jgi:hypothetical protein
MMSCCEASGMISVTRGRSIFAMIVTRQEHHERLARQSRKR